MKRLLAWGTVMALLTSPFTIVAEDATTELKGKAAILEGKKLLADSHGNPKSEKLTTARKMFLAATRSEDSAALASYYVGLVDFRRIPAVQERGQAALKSHLDGAIAHLEKAIALDPKCADAYALLSSCMGQKIGSDMQLAMSLGPKSMEFMQTAESMNPKNPRVVLLSAISKYHTPEMWGGGKKKGLEGFRKAAKLFPDWKAPSTLHPSWGHDEAYAWIGLAHLDSGEKDKAKKALEKALAINPNNSWVKYVLMPRCDK